jgi:hypothetical protein
MKLTVAISYDFTNVTPDIVVQSADSENAEECSERRCSESLHGETGSKSITVMH